MPATSWRRYWAALALLSLGASACAPASYALGNAVTNGTAEKNRGASGLLNTAPEEQGPQGDPCQPVDGRPPRAGCDAVRRQALTFARRLAVGESVCLEGASGGLDVTRLCRARARVVDAASGKVLLEIRDAQPGTRFETEIQHQRWFYDAALVALYLEANGYP
jgi:hypothetical protein